MLLCNYLTDVVDDIAFDAQVKRLIRILGLFGAIVVPWAAELSRPAPAKSGRLRSAAINILGGTQQQSAVDPLIACLGDTNQFIVERSISSLVRLGPENALPRVIAALETSSTAPGSKEVHLAALKILERFLNEPRVERQLSTAQHQRIIEAIIAVHTADYASEAQQKASEMLVLQGSAARERKSGEKALELLMQKLAAEDETIVRSITRMLKEIGTSATPALLSQLNIQSPEIVRMRIIEVLGSVRDMYALPRLLCLVADPSLVVQQQVANTLRAYAPESIPGLIDLVLHDPGESVATRAEHILASIGAEAVRPIMQALLPVVYGRTYLLVNVLEHVHDPQAIPALIALLETPELEQMLATAVIHTLSKFPDRRVVQPLLDVLANSNALIYEGAINALSNLGGVALDTLIAALDDGQETLIVSRVQRVLLSMVEFPGEQLLSAMARGSEAQAQHIVELFLSKGVEAAQVLVAHLFDEDAHLRGYVREALSRMNG